MNDYYQEAGAFFTRTDNTLLDIQNMQIENGRLLEQQQKWNQDHAVAVQELRQDTTTMNDNITPCCHFGTLGKTDNHVQLGGVPPRFIN